MTQPKKLPLVYVLGDSISIHYGPYLERAVAGFFRYARKTGEEEAMRDLDIPRGANGGDSDRASAFLEAFLPSPLGRPDVLLLNCGLHDIRRDTTTRAFQVPLERYCANLEKMVELCLENGVKMVWVRSTPVVDKVHNWDANSGFSRHAEDLETYNAAADRIMAEREIPSVDLHLFTLNLGQIDEAFCDHVHFREEVRERQGIFIAGCLVGLTLAGKFA